MSYQIATEGFFDMFKKKKPQSTNVRFVDDDYDNDPQIWADRAQTHFPCLAINRGKVDNRPTSSRLTGSAFTLPQYESLVQNQLFVGQLNLKDLKYNPHLPKSGLLQFYADYYAYDKGLMVFISEKDFGKLTETNSQTDGVSISFSKLNKPTKRLTMDEVWQFFTENGYFSTVFGPPVTYQTSINEVYDADANFPEILTVGLDNCSVNYAMRKGAIKGTNTQILIDKDISVNVSFD